MAQTPNEEHYQTVAENLLAGRVVPFLGAGVNLSGRPASATFEPGSCLPSGAELAVHLAKDIRYPYADPTDLMRVSQYFDVKLGVGRLYEALHKVFDADYPPTPVHRLLASLPALIRTRRTDGPRFFPLIVTTNYDDALERAFDEANEPYDLVTYVADRRDRGKFKHTRPDGTAQVISVPNTYSELRCDERPVIAKIHGAVDRRSSEDDSFVVTENHYIEYLSRTDITQLVPINMATRMMKAHFLFLGYSLKDWNLRVILHRLWGDEGLGYNSWAIQPNPELIDAKAWFHRGVELFDARLEDYTDELGRQLSSVATSSGLRT